MTLKRFDILLTEEQLRILEAKTVSAGFRNKSEYIRFMLFMEISITEKINEIHEKIVKNAP